MAYIYPDDMPVTVCVMNVDGQPCILLQQQGQIWGWDSLAEVRAELEHAPLNNDLDHEMSTDAIMWLKAQPRFATMTTQQAVDLIAEQAVYLIGPHLKVAKMKPEAVEVWQQATPFPE